MRSTIILLMGVCADVSVERAADAMIHLWYSALLPKLDIDQIVTPAVALIRDVYMKVKDKVADTLSSKSWQFGDTTIRVVLGTKDWTEMSKLSVPKDLTAEKAQKARCAITLARKDNLDRHLFQQLPGHRVSLTTFREDGMLLPFSSSRGAFTQPNP